MPSLCSVTVGVSCPKSYHNFCHLVTFMKMPLHPRHPQKQIRGMLSPPPPSTVRLPHHPRPPQKHITGMLSNPLHKHCEVARLYFFLLAGGFSRFFCGVHVLWDLQDDVLVIGVQCHHRGARNGLHVLRRQTLCQQQQTTHQWQSLWTSVCVLEIAECSNGNKSDTEQGPEHSSRINTQRELITTQNT